MKRWHVVTEATPGSPEHGIGPSPREYFAGIGGNEQIIWSDDVADAVDLSRAVAKYLAAQLGACLREAG